MTHRRWQESVFASLKAGAIEVVAYVPDAGHAALIEQSCRDPEIEDVVLTSEEEGVALCTGASLGGKRAVLLMQSSGVGNCVNMFALQRIARTPLVLIVTMRGEHDEFNPWQVPMGSTAADVLRLCQFEVHRVEQAEQAAASVDAAIRTAYENDSAVAVLFAQKMLGPKQW